MGKKKDKNKKSKKEPLLIAPQNKERSLIPISEKTDEYLIELNKKIIFVFKDYLHKECGFKKITQPKNLINKLTHLSTLTRPEITENTSIIKRIIPFAQKNEYKKLFGRPEFQQYETDFYEVVCYDIERVFWYFVGNIFHIVLIMWWRHLKVDKR